MVLSAKFWLQQVSHSLPALCVSGSHFFLRRSYTDFSFPSVKWSWREDTHRRVGPTHTGDIV